MQQTKEKCIICNVNLKNENIRWLIECKCGIQFHDRCLIDEWYLNDHFCPFCKIKHDKNKKYHKVGYNYRFIMNNKEVKPIYHGDDFLDD